MSWNKTALVLGMCGVLTACATDDPNRRAKIGAGVGAVAGAVLGHQVSNKHGAVVGAAVGAIAGGVTGNYMDKQQAEFNQALEQERQRNELEIERLKDDTLKLSLDSEVSFAFGSAELQPAFQRTLGKLAEVLQKYDRTVVHVIGHTDSVGSEAFNMDLSLRRAQSVVDYLVSSGVPSSRLRVEGRGESEPRSTNSTEAGRQLNRRVEVYVKPVVEGEENKAYQSPNYN